MAHLEDRIDENAHGGSLGGKNQKAKKKQDGENRDHPEFFPDLEEEPQFFKKIHAIP